MSALWKPVVSPYLEGINNAVAMCFDISGTTGWIGARAPFPDYGGQIIKSTDGGINWAMQWPTNSSSSKTNTFLSCAVASRSSAVMTGLKDQMYTTDGMNWNVSNNEYLQPSLEVSALPDGTFGMTITGTGSNGVATSPNGQHWINFDMGVDGDIYTARYASFPTTSTWFVSAGHPPFISTYDTTTDITNCTVNAEHCYSAGIFKTSDAGATWSTVYNNVDTGDNIYPNQIDCFDVNHCVVAMMGDTCRIMATSDGGLTWQTSHTDFNSNCFLTDVQMISSTYTWVGGYTNTFLKSTGNLFQSTDGAKSWTLEQIPDFEVLDIEMNNLFGFVMGQDRSSHGTSLLQYVGPNP
jgi:photosystem II stability/assembly factor-like uncharacterized protein